MKTYKKPVVIVDAGMAEGVYAASGASQEMCIRDSLQNPEDPDISCSIPE